MLTGRRMGAGSVLIEAAMALSMLTVLGLVLLQFAISTVAPRQWNLLQAITDSYMSYEVAYAERVTFDDLTGDNSPWPVYPQNTETTMELGRLPGGKAINATVIRTRMADSNNLTAHGGTGTAATNPASMITWQVMSVVKYRVGNRNYVKSRTVIRFQ